MASTSSQLPAPDNDQTDSTHFILIEPKHFLPLLQAPLIKEWNRAIATYFPKDAKALFTVLEGTLQSLAANLLECDCMVSPANSFGIMDGGYDGILSDAFIKPNKGYWTLTNHVQAYLKRESRGYLPPGSCLIVPLPDDLAGANNRWGARFIAVVPTMRTPAVVSWHKDLVYNCMWSLQVAIDNWNRGHVDTAPIRRVLATGLGTGCGRVGAKKCATQMVLAVHHFTQPIMEQPRWSDIAKCERDTQIEATVDFH